MQRGSRSGNARAPGGHRRSDRHAYGLRMELEFEQPVGPGDARQIARRIAEALRAAALVGQDLQGLQSCRLVSPDLRQVIEIGLGPEGRPQPTEPETDADAV